MGPLTVTTAVKTRRSQKHSGPVVMMALGTVLFVTAIYAAVTLVYPSPISLPKTLVGFSLARAIYGREAVTEITRLHSLEFPLTSGAVGTYDNSVVEMWVAGAPVPWTATAMVRTMTDGIAEGRSPFTPLGPRTVAGRTVYELTGMGQRHFYFQSGRLVIWLAVNETVMESALSEVLKFYP